MKGYNNKLPYFNEPVDSCYMFVSNWFLLLLNSPATANGALIFRLFPREVLRKLEFHKY